MHTDAILVVGHAELIDLALALALGLLVGLQRGWVQRRDAAGTRFAGVRTYGLIGLTGGIAGIAAPHAAAFALVLVAAAAGLVMLGYWRTSRAGTTAVSGTSALVGLLTLACGYLAGSGALAAAAAATGSIVLLLALRAPLHGLVRSLDEREMQAIGRFALIALVILPLLPDVPFGPLDAWRPRSLCHIQRFLIRRYRHAVALARVGDDAVNRAVGVDAVHGLHRLIDRLVPEVARIAEVDARL